MDFGKVAQTKKLISATDTDTVKCKCLFAEKKNNYQSQPTPPSIEERDKRCCYLPATDLTVTYVPSNKDCTTPVWAFDVDTAPKDGNAGDCAVLFREEVIPPEYRKQYSVMCGGDQTAAFDLFGLARTVRVRETTRRVCLGASLVFVVVCCAV